MKVKIVLKRSVIGIFFLLYVNYLFAQVFEVDICSVGAIYSDNQIIGTGFVGIDDKTIITCAHVVSGKSDLKYKTLDGISQNIFLDTLLRAKDIAILKSNKSICASPNKIDFFPIVSIGMRIFILGVDTRFDTIRQQDGIISRVFENNSSGLITGALEIESYVRKGYSGSPIYNQTGNVIGMIQAFSTNGNSPVAIGVVLSPLYNN